MISRPALILVLLSLWILPATVSAADGKAACARLKGRMHAIAESGRSDPRLPYWLSRIPVGRLSDCDDPAEIERATRDCEESNRASWPSIHCFPPRFSYKILYNVALVCEKLHDRAGALAFFERYLAEAGPDLPEERRITVEKSIEELRSQVARVSFTDVPAGATIRIDGVELDVGPLTEPLLVNAGSHRIEIVKPGFKDSKHVIDAEAGATEVVSARLTRAESPSKSSQTVPPSTHRGCGCELAKREPAAPVAGIAMGMIVVVLRRSRAHGSSRVAQLGTSARHAAC